MAGVTRTIRHGIHLIITDIITRGIPARIITDIMIHGITVHITEIAGIVILTILIIAIRRIGQG